MSTPSATSVPTAQPLNHTETGGLRRARPSLRHREQQKASKRAKYQRMRRIINEAKSAPCVDCGGRFAPWVMDLHHLADKAMTVTKACNYREDVLRAEIAKCIVLCANCHRERHGAGSKAAV